MIDSITYPISYWLLNFIKCYGNDIELNRVHDYYCKQYYDIHFEKKKGFPIIYGKVLSM